MASDWTISLACSVRDPPADAAMGSVLDAAIRAQLKL
jgi:hypothetical protein